MAKQRYNGQTLKDLFDAIEWVREENNKFGYEIDGTRFALEKMICAVERKVDDLDTKIDKNNETCQTLQGILDSDASRRNKEKWDSIPGDDWGEKMKNMIRGKYDK